MMKSGSAQSHPFVALLFLLLLMIAGAVIFTILAFAAGLALFGMQELAGIAQSGTASTGMLRVLQIFTSTGMFIVPAIFLARMESADWLGYLKIYRVPLILLILSIVIIFSAAPALELSLTLNKAMKLPDYLKGLEEWMKMKEREMAGLTKRLLEMQSPDILLVNLLMLAVIPAVGEELIFRGVLQKLFSRWTGNHHAAIWLTAIIFSAIHFQFYGFLPRMLLGAMFGYLLVWSGSIWVPVLMHFINNSVAVITAYVYQQKGIPLERMDQPENLSALIYVFSSCASVALLWVFYTLSRKYSAKTVH